VTDTDILKILHSFVCREVLTLEAPSWCFDGQSCQFVGGVVEWLGSQSLAGGLSLTCAYYGCG